MITGDENEDETLYPLMVCLLQGNRDQIHTSALGELFL
jgi:hypothetical protein